MAIRIDVEAQDQSGQEYVTDLRNNLAQIWTRAADVQAGRIHAPALPYGIAADTHLNRVYVVLTTPNDVYGDATKPPYMLLFVIR